MASVWGRTEQSPTTSPTTLRIAFTREGLYKMMKRLNVE